MQAATAFRRHRNGLIYQQQAWNGDWRVVVICPHRGLQFGALTPVQEFVELQPRDGQSPITPLARVCAASVMPCMSKRAQTLWQPRYSS